MGSDAVLLSIILDWTFLNPLIERDDGRAIKASEELQEQTLAEQQISPEVYY